MKVRVFDNKTAQYFNSEVYAVIKIGIDEKYVICVSSVDGKYIKIYDYDGIDNQDNYKKLINIIVPDIPSVWIKQELESGLNYRNKAEFKKLLNKEVQFNSYLGYDWLFENKTILATLLDGNSLPYQGSIFESEDVTSEKNDWTYVETQTDVDRLLGDTGSFHDSVLVEANYTSGSSVDSNGGMYPFDDIRRVALCFGSQYCNSIEMVFEGVTAFNLRPTPDQYTSEILEASLFIKDATVFFCDSEIEKWDESYNGTWITAYSLRWRFVK